MSHTMTAQSQNQHEDDPAFDALADEARREVSIEQRLRDAEENPLYAATFDPEEAEELGFFIEEALTPEEAESAMLDHDRLREQMLAAALPEPETSKANYEISYENRPTPEEVNEAYADILKLKGNAMTTTARRPRNKYKYMPTYDYSQVGNWSMTKEEAGAIMNEASRLLEAGDEEGYFRESKKLPLPPNMALSMRDKKGKETLLAEGWNLADAEIVYGKDWLDNYMVD